MLLRNNHTVVAVLLIEFLLAVSYAVLLLIAIVSFLLPNTCGMLIMLFLRYHIMVRGEIVVERSQMALQVVVCIANIRERFNIGELRYLILGDAILLIEFLHSHMV